MKENLAEKIQLANPLFESTQPLSPDGESITILNLAQLHSFPNHPFHLRNIPQISESISRVGVIEPIIVRPLDTGGYQTIAGHRRTAGSKEAGIMDVPAIVRHMDDDTAIILMVDSNLENREDILPSEKAFAYKLKLEALKRQGARRDLTSSQVGTKLRADEKIAEDSGESRNQVQRYIRLTELIQPILDYVDEEKIKFNPAVALSYLTKVEQEKLYEIMQLDEVAPSLEQAIRLKEMSQKGTLNEMDILRILKEQKPNQKKLSVSFERIASFIPKAFDTPKKQEEFIIKACEAYSKHLQRKARQNER